MTPVQSWATIVLLICLSITLTKLIADLDAALDRRQAAKLVRKDILPLPEAETLSAPDPFRSIPVMSSDGFPIPGDDEIYDYAVHGI
ncbi:hypothetical protein [Arthrobacter bambusae]|uniref:Uncharacterized protein n=1 Tax=Arthrobacter bambusae TaxID=1338426 RepID=A0AAW8DDG8_9MICC|nr:hypothetical protein [Arthrobacter bambusae]MDP9903219.1 hypothetical protein [Arthrobacter bambusae]MDQ0128787.1 hypothetical protein [Arthrobacter bambusae]MDQ0180128.1 hypothetical protein [Arthrobacter bambusae]